MPRPPSPPDAEELRRRKQLGDRVRSLRRKANLGQGRLAHAAGMERSTLQRIEYGQTNPSIGILWAIADQLNVPVTRLLASDAIQPSAGGVPPGADGRTCP